jgi:zinc transport system substrate-binding protein
MKKVLSLGVITVLIIAISVALSTGNNNNLQSKPKVATSIFPIYDIANNIAGDRVEVVNVLPVGVSEHTFEPTVSDLAKLNGVSKAFLIGQELDTNWAENPIKNASENAEIVYLDRGINLLEHKEHSDEEDTEEHSDYDPHYWLSVENAKIIAARIKNELIKLSPKDESYFEDNYLKYFEQLENLIAENNSKVATLTNKEIITFHDAFNYLAEELGIEVKATVEEFPGKTPSAAYIAEVGKIIEEYNIKILFKEPQLSDEIVTALAQDYNATILTLDPLGGIQGRASYIDLIRYNVDTIVNGLKQ